MNKTVSSVVAVIAVALGAWYFMSQPKIPVINETENVEELGTLNATVKEVSVITFTESGYSPNPLTIKAGETVKFVNNSEQDFWPASAMYPTHTVYPGSGIEKCDTDARSSLFDSCEGIAPGDSWEFTFNEVGEWAYHDHLRAKFFGKVIVE